ncbi:MAG: hypothetical protein PW844_20870 [Pantoea sp.]|uniref:hypothetical protein n=1 Tax=Pantoea sp. TaxID=69393 RepID=UPI00239F718E|nr:hypothetical protein [Pantoea sp.]MDE1188885.1 hypothetical protein [Pantoea sp.]
MSMQEFVKAARLRTGEIRLTEVTQSLSRFGSPPRQRPAYKDWISRLKRGEKLPRGRYFRGKKPGRLPLVMDEFWNFMQ